MGLKRFRVGKDKLGSTFNAEQRRKELVKRIFGSGGLPNTTETELSVEFGVSQNQISKDLKICKEWITEHYGDDAIYEISTAYKGAMKHLRKKNDYKTLALFLKGYTEFVFKTGKIEMVPDKIQHSLSEIITIDDIKHGYEKVKDKYRDKTSDP